MKPPRDLTSEAGARAWVEEMKSYARETFRSTGDLPPSAALIIRRDERTGASLPEPTIMWVGIASQVVNDNRAFGSKDKLAIYLRRVASRTDAIGFVFMSEAWTLSEAQRKRIGNHQSWENVEGRGEGVILNYQHKALGEGTFSWAAEVIRPKRSKPRLGPWVESERGTRGRFANVLVPVESQAKAEEAMAGLLAFGADLSPDERRDRMDAACARLVAEGKISEADARDVKARLITEIRERGLEIPERPGDPRPAPSPAVGLVDLQDIDFPTKGGQQ